jgi:Mn2+/Fe2+ NRAMP family transporter
MAGAAIGVSHVVQSTRAGAEYGLALVGLVLAVNLLKYPFFEAGHRYTVATGESLLAGYRKLGRGFLYGFLALNAFTAVISIAGVTIVTAVLAPRFGVAEEWTPATVSALIMLLCGGLLGFGHYRWLDRAIKVMMFVLFIATVVAFAMAAANPGEAVAGFVAPSPWSLAALPFLIALMGWMPAPIEMSVWQSLWILASEKDRQRRTTRREAMVDFNVGYVMTTLLAMMFVALGAWIMHGSGRAYAAGGAPFATEFIALYTEKLGAWTWPIIAAAAFTTMLSTTLTVIDAYPRSLAAGLRMALPRLGGSDRGWHVVFIVVGCVLGWGIIRFFSGHFTALIDLITTVAFLTAPVFAFLNHRLVSSRHLPEDFRPGLLHKLVSGAGMGFLVGFSLLFLWQRFLVD